MERGRHQGGCQPSPTRREHKMWVQNGSFKRKWPLMTLGSPSSVVVVVVPQSVMNLPRALLQFSPKDTVCFKVSELLVPFKPHDKWCKLPKEETTLVPSGNECSTYDQKYESEVTRSRNLFHLLSRRHLWEGSLAMKFWVKWKNAQMFDEWKRPECHLASSF